MLAGHEEYQYLKLIDEILSSGLLRKKERTGTGTIGIIGNTMRFNLRDGAIPVLTTKTVFWKGVVHELLFFIRGDTNAKHLSDLGVGIWDHNTANTDGCIGPMYGFQWRHFGAAWEGPNADYRGKGTDQLAYVLEKLTKSPESRDILMSAWNPMDLSKGVLSPCHFAAHFCTEIRSADGTYDLTCVVSQRSADVGLGVPFNIASYALLTAVVAKACGMHAKELVYMTNDTHIYLNHIEPLKVQRAREPFPFPRLDLSEWQVSTSKPLESIEALRYDQIKLKDYQSHPRLKMEFSA